MPDRQNKSKVLLLIIGILLVSNIAMLCFFLMQKDAHPERPDRKAVIASFLKKEIGFNKAQLAQYDTLSNRHRENMKATFEGMRNRKDEQFKTLAAAGFSDSVMEQLAGQSGAEQKAIELRMFTHMRSIRDLCTPAQQPKFDTSFYKVFNRRGGDEKKDKKK